MVCGQSSQVHRWQWKCNLTLYSNRIMQRFFIFEWLIFFPLNQQNAYAQIFFNNNVVLLHYICWCNSFFFCSLCNVLDDWRCERLLVVPTVTLWTDWSAFAGPCRPTLWWRSVWTAACSSVATTSAWSSHSVTQGMSTKIFFWTLGFYLIDFFCRFHQ